MNTPEHHESLERVALPRTVAERILLRQTRRKFLTNAVGSLGSLALGLMAGSRRYADSMERGVDPRTGRWRGVTNPPPWRPRARRVIH